MRQKNLESLKENGGGKITNQHPWEEATGRNAKDVILRDLRRKPKVPRETVQCMPIGAWEWAPEFLLCRSPQLY